MYYFDLYSSQSKYSALLFEIATGSTDHKFFDRRIGTQLTKVSKRCTFYLVTSEC